MPGATYRQTSLTSFQEVEDNVAALRILEMKLNSNSRPSPSARNLSNFLRIVTKGASTSYLQVITAQTIEQPTSETPSTSCGAVWTRVCCSSKALGGGWNVSNLPGSARREFAILESGTDGDNFWTAWTYTQRAFWPRRFQRHRSAESLNPS